MGQTAGRTDRSRYRLVTQRLDCAPRILEMFELCICGHAVRICRRSCLAHTMNAFSGRFTCGELPAASGDIAELAAAAAAALGLSAYTRHDRSAITSNCGRCCTGIPVDANSIQHVSGSNCLQCFNAVGWYRIESVLLHGE